MAAPVEKVAVYDLLEKFGIEPSQDFALVPRLFETFKSQFLDVSADKGLIDLDRLAVSGDGTLVYTGAKKPQNPYLQLSGKRYTLLQM